MKPKFRLFSIVLVLLFLMLACSLPGQQGADNNGAEGSELETLIAQTVEAANQQATLDALQPPGGDDDSGDDGQQPPSPTDSQTPPTPTNTPLPTPTPLSYQVKLGDTCGGIAWERGGYCSQRYATYSRPAA